MAERITYLEAIRRALRRAMRDDPRVFLLGEDIGVYGGAFKLTDGFLEEFGAERVIDTPIAESGIVGAAIGAAMAGLRPVVEIQFIDFIACAVNPLVNFAAKARFRWRAGVPLVVRGPTGGGVHAGPYHSQSPESFFLNTPGLKLVVPSTPSDAYTMLLGAIVDPDPVLYFEQKALYRTLKEEVDEGAAPIAPGRAATRRSGGDVTLITWGAMLQRVLEAAEGIARDGIEAEVLDLRSLAPLDEEAIVTAARKTGKVLVVHEASTTGGFGGEVAARVASAAFEWLDAPVRRLGSLDIPIPYAGVLEDASLPGPEAIAEEARALARY